MKSQHILLIYYRQFLELQTKLLYSIEAAKRPLTIQIIIPTVAMSLWLNQA